MRPRGDLAERSGDPRVRGFSRRHPGPARVGVLVLHGFTATPLTVAGWAEELHRAGADVEVPLLPGHGTTPADCDATTWGQWLAAAAGALSRLENDVVVVAGISMGGGLALRLAQLQPHRVRGVVLANPAVALDPLRTLAVATVGRVAPTWPAIAGDLADPDAVVLAYDRTPLRALVSQVAGWAEVRRDLALVHQPLLLLRSRVDHVVPPVSARTILRGVSSRQVTEVVYANGFHEITSDLDAEAVFAETVRFVTRLAR